MKIIFFIDAISLIVLEIFLSAMPFSSLLAALCRENYYWDRKLIYFSYCSLGKNNKIRKHLEHNIFYFSSILYRKAMIQIFYAFIQICNFFYKTICELTFEHILSLLIFPELSANNIIWLLSFFKKWRNSIRLIMNKRVSYSGPLFLSCLKRPK